jgi:hypothetical protein
MSVMISSIAAALAITILLALSVTDMEEEYEKLEGDRAIYLSFSSSHCNH